MRQWIKWKLDPFAKSLWKRTFEKLNSPRIDENFSYFESLLSRSDYQTTSKLLPNPLVHPSVRRSTQIPIFWNRIAWNASESRSSKLRPKASNVQSLRPWTCKGGRRTQPRKLPFGQPFGYGAAYVPASIPVGSIEDRPVRGDAVTKSSGRSVGHAVHADSFPKTSSARHLRREIPAWRPRRVLYATGRWSGSKWWRRWRKNERKEEERARMEVGEHGGCCLARSQGHPLTPLARHLWMKSSPPLCARAILRCTCAPRLRAHVALSLHTTASVTMQRVVRIIVVRTDRLLFPISVYR